MHQNGVSSVITYARGISPGIPPGKEHTLFDLPIRVDVATGDRLEPTGSDPYALPWVQGAATTVHGATRKAYASQLTDLADSLAQVKAKRPEDFADREEYARYMEARIRGIVLSESVPAYGPRARTEEFRLLDMGRMTVDWEIAE